MDDMLTKEAEEAKERRRVLGRQVGLPASPEEAKLEAIPVPDSEPVSGMAVVRFSVPEFTSLCPVTGQPDFARIYIDFVPNRHLVESKSLKLFMGSYRNHGAFHEEVTCQIGRRLTEVLDPVWLRVTAFWYPRGGIPIDVVWETGPKPSQFWTLPLNVKPFDGR